MDDQYDEIIELNSSGQRVGIGEKVRMKQYRRGTEYGSFRDGEFVAGTTEKILYSPGGIKKLDGLSLRHGANSGAAYSGSGVKKAPEPITSSPYQRQPSSVEGLGGPTDGVRSPDANSRAANQPTYTPQNNHSSQPGGVYNASGNKNVTSASARAAEGRTSQSGFNFFDVDTPSAGVITGTRQREVISQNKFKNTDSAYSQFISGERPVARIEAIEGGGSYLAGFDGTSGNIEIDRLYKDLEKLRFNNSQGRVQAAEYASREAGLMDQIAGVQAQSIEGAAPGFMQDYDFQSGLIVEAASNAAMNSAAGLEMNIDDLVSSLGYGEEGETYRQAGIAEIKELKKGLTVDAINNNERVKDVETRKANRIAMFRKGEATRDPVTGELTRQSQTALDKIIKEFDAEIEEEKSDIRSDIQADIDAVNVRVEKELRSVKKAEQTARMAFEKTKQSQDFTLRRDQVTQDNQEAGEIRRANLELQKQKMLRGMDKKTYIELASSLSALIKGKSAAELTSLRSAIVQNAVDMGSTVEEAEASYDALLSDAQASESLAQRNTESLIAERGKSKMPAVTPFDQQLRDTEAQYASDAGIEPEEDFDSMSIQELSSMLSELESGDDAYNFVFE